MESDKDVLSKADALLRRHTAPGSETGAYPVLTDLIDHPDGAAADEIVRDVHARVMAAIELHLAGDLEKRLAEKLAPQIQSAVATALEELRKDLAATIADALAAALERPPVK